MNKKIFGLLIVLISLSCAIFAASKQRQDIDKFLKEYEVFVTKTEKAANTGKIVDLADLSIEALKFTEEAEKIEDYDEWSVADATKFLDLSNRYTKAALKLSEMATDMTSDYSDLLNAYGL
ncbi:MAG: hypothetical protein K5829_11540 [Treponema sp.]|nr:hypothetical protein [Treponema sp.]